MCHSMVLAHVSQLANLELALRSHHPARIRTSYAVWICHRFSLVVIGSKGTWLNEMAKVGPRHFACQGLKLAGWMFLPPIRSSLPRLAIGFLRDAKANRVESVHESDFGSRSLQRFGKNVVDDLDCKDLSRSFLRR